VLNQSKASDTMWLSFQASLCSLCEYAAFHGWLMLENKRYPYFETEVRASILKSWAATIYEVEVNDPMYSRSIILQRSLVHISCCIVNVCDNGLVVF